MYTVRAANTDVKKVSVSKTRDGAAIGTVDIINGTGTITVQKSDLNLVKVGDQATLFFKTDLASNATYTSAVTVANPIAIASVNIGQIDTIADISFDVSPRYSDVTATNVFLKVGRKGNYTAVAAPDDAVPITGTDYNVNDTLYVKVEATTAVGTATEEKFFVVQRQVFSSRAEATLDVNPTVSYDLVDLEVFEGSADVKFVHDPGAGTQGLQGLTAEFIAITADEYATGDAYWTEHFFAGHPTTKDLSDLGGDEHFIFRTQRKEGGNTVYYYGMLKVIEVGPFSDHTKDYVTFEVKY